RLATAKLGSRPPVALMRQNVNRCIPVSYDTSAVDSAAPRSGLRTADLLGPGPPFDHRTLARGLAQTRRELQARGNRLQDPRRQRARARVVVVEQVHQRPD